jgi:hypothetical protein
MRACAPVAAEDTGDAKHEHTWYSNADAWYGARLDRTIWIFFVELLPRPDWT